MAGPQAALGAGERRLLPELAHGPDRAGGHIAESLAGLDPPVLDFGLGGLSAEEHDAIRMRIDPAPPPPRHGSMNASSLGDVRSRLGRDRAWNRGRSRWREVARPGLRDDRADVLLRERARAERAALRSGAVPTRSHGDRSARFEPAELDVPRHRSFGPPLRASTVRSRAPGSSGYWGPRGSPTCSYRFGDGKAAFVQASTSWMRGVASAARHASRRSSVRHPGNAFRSTVRLA